MIRQAAPPVGLELSGDLSPNAHSDHLGHNYTFGELYKGNRLVCIESNLIEIRVEQLKLSRNRN